MLATHFPLLEKKSKAHTAAIITIFATGRKMLSHTSFLTLAENKTMNQDLKKSEQDLLSISAGKIYFINLWSAHTKLFEIFIVSVLYVLKDVLKFKLYPKVLSFK